MECTFQEEGFGLPLFILAACSCLHNIIRLPLDARFALVGFICVFGFAIFRGNVAGIGRICSALGRGASVFSYFVAQYGRA